jgi:hypothetical protein
MTTTSKRKRRRKIVVDEDYCVCCALSSLYGIGSLWYWNQQAIWEAGGAHGSTLPLLYRRRLRSGLSRDTRDTVMDVDDVANQVHQQFRSP